MLKVTKKQYEVELPIQGLADDEETILYEFNMRITPDELKEINDIIFSADTIKLAKKTVRANEEEADELEEKLEEKVLNDQERFEDICFKEHKEPFKKEMGDYKYLEMVDMMYDFFWNAFAEKKKKQANTMISDLRKITGN